MKVLKARLYELEQRRKREKIDKLEDAKTDIAWGNQIRSYVLHPYRMIKDMRTRMETGDTDAGPRRRPGRFHQGRPGPAEEVRDAARVLGDPPSPVSRGRRLRRTFRRPSRSRASRIFRRESTARISSSESRSPTASRSAPSDRSRTFCTSPRGSFRRRFAGGTFLSENGTPSTKLFMVRNVREWSMRMALKSAVTSTFRVCRSSLPTMSSKS